MLAATLAASAMMLAAIMAFAWMVQQRTGNSGWVDAAWSFGVGACGIAGALVALTQPQTDVWRIAAVIVIASAWSLRLGGHIWQRSRGRHDDPRYAELSHQWGADAPRKMFAFLQQQAWVSAPFVWAIILAAWNPVAGWRWLDLLALALAVIAIALEGKSDRQLRAFIHQRNRPHAPAVLDTGLWAWSRHPNYFFQWLGWLAWPMLAINFTGAFPAGWLALLAPIIMYVLLTRVSGIPPLEAHMLRKHGEAYREYQRRVPAFFPMPAGQSETA